MRNQWHTPIALATTFLLTAALTALSPTVARADAIRWAADLESAQAQASREGRLVLIHFWADNCPPCLRLEANVFSRPEVAEAIASKYVPVKVHAQRRSDLSRRFGVDRWPTDVVITPTGQKITSMVSPQDPRQYVQAFNQIATNMLPPMPATQTAGLAPPPSNQPYSNRYTGTDPLSATTPPPPSRYGPTGNPSLAARGATGAEAPWNTGQYHARQSAAYTPQANGNVYGNNQAAVTPPQQAAVIPPQQGSAYGSQYGGGYGNSQTAYGQGSSYDYNPPAGQTDSAPQAAPYQPRYANQAPQDAPHSTISQPAPQAQPTYNPYANMNQAPATSPPPPAYQPQQPRQTTAQPRSQYGNPPPAADQRRQVWEWEQQPRQAAAHDPSMAEPRQPAYGQPNREPDPRMAQAPQVAPQPQQPAGHPPIALDGFCPVALFSAEPAWVEGDPAYGAVHRGRTYLFHSEAAQQQFLQAPDQFAPALSGYDPVRFVEEKQIVPGVRKFGWFYKGQYYLFADEAGLLRFEKSPDLYVGVVQQAMQGGPGQQQAPQANQYR